MLGVAYIIMSLSREEKNWNNDDVNILLKYIPTLWKFKVLNPLFSQLWGNNYNITFDGRVFFPFSIILGNFSFLVQKSLNNHKTTSLKYKIYLETYLILETYEYDEI